MKKEQKPKSIKPTRESNFKDEIEYIAEKYWTLYYTLLEKGFSVNQAFQFTKEYIKR